MSGGTVALADQEPVDPMGERAYCDHNASTPLRPAAAEAVTRALAIEGNPSSIHAEGRDARALIDRARRQVAAAIGGAAKDILFTSGATEALSTMLRPAPAIAGGGRRLLVLATEHSAALAGGGFGPDRVETIPVTAEGLVDLTWLERRLVELEEPVTVAVQAANGETGVVQPLAEAAALVRRHGGLLVCDAVAAFGKMPFDVDRLGADAYVLSGHKFGAPKGVGAVLLWSDRARIQEPLLGGGGQEMRRRSGTENVAGIAGMGAAAAEAASAVEREAPRLAALRDRLLAGLRATRPDLVVFGEAAPRLPNTLNIGVPGLRSETAVIAFDLAGVAISSGSACSSGKVKRSHVLDAMGVAPALADGALRFSLGWTTTEREIDQAIAAFGRIAGRETNGMAA